MDNERKFEELKVVAERFYKSIGEVYCPYFAEKIIFNSKGLEHLKFKKKNYTRTLGDQYIRLKLLHLAPKILMLSKTVQGISERKIFEPNLFNRRNEYILTNAFYYEFVSVIEKVRVRIIVRQVGQSQRYFWSIIPYWKMNKMTGKRKLFDGDPEED